MKCPYCFKEIADQIMAKYLAAKGGRKSKRILTSEQAKEMARRSAEVRKKKKEMKDER